MLQNIFLIAFLVFGIGTVPPALAATLQAGKTVFSGSAMEDTYFAGGTVTVSSPIKGDLLVAAGEVNISSHVSADVLVVGGEVSAQGSVDGDMRIAGGEVVIGAEVNEDVLIFGGQVTLATGSIVHGDVYLAGGEIQVLGKIDGRLFVRGGTVRLEGAVEGPVDLVADALVLSGTIQRPSRFSAAHLTLGTGAALYGDLEYWTEAGAVDFGGALHGASATYKPYLNVSASEQLLRAATPGWERALGYFFGTFLTYEFLSAYFIILLLVFFRTRFFSEAAVVLRRSLLHCLLAGLLFFILLPATALAFLMTVLGLPVAIFLLSCWIFSFWFSTPISVLVYSHFLVHKLQKEFGRPMFLLVCLGVLFFFLLLSQLPWVGWLVHVVVVLSAVGALVNVWRSRPE